MSYPSVQKHLETLGVTNETATDEQRQKAFIAAVQEDLPLGWVKVNELVEKLKEIGERVMLSLNPNSEEGKQYARLLGPDMPRQVLQNHFDVAFGFYNCCGGVAAESFELLDLSLREQIDAQHPNFVDC